MIVSIDVGYGDTKVAILKDGEITHLFKFPSCVAYTNKNVAIRDPRILTYKGEDYYVGDDALQLVSSSIVNMQSYEKLEYYAPLLIAKALQIAQVKQSDIKALVSGLSVAQIGQTGYFKQAIQNFTVNDEVYQFNNVFLLPQGAGCKLSLDRYDLNYPEKRINSTVYNAVVADIGFNTLDVFLITEGRSSPNLFEGIANAGVIKIATLIVNNIKEQYNKDVSLQEAKEILDTKVYKLRGHKYDMKQVVQEAVDKYQKIIMELIEQKYGAAIDKCDYVALLGGGATVIANSNSKLDDFFKVPKQYAEFYNTIGYALFGEKQLAS